MLKNNNLVQAFIRFMQKYLFAIKHFGYRLFKKLRKIILNLKLDCRLIYENAILKKRKTQARLIFPIILGLVLPAINFFEFVSRNNFSEFNFEIIAVATALILGALEEFYGMSDSQERKQLVFSGVIMCISCISIAVMIKINNFWQFSMIINSPIFTFGTISVLLACLYINFLSIIIPDNS